MTIDINHGIDGLPAAIGFADILKLVRRRLWLIFAVTLVLTLLAALILSTIAPRFSAEALLMIDSRGADQVNLESVITGRGSDPETVLSEIQVLKSRHLANMVIEQLELFNQSEFNDELQTTGLVESSAASPITDTDNLLIQGQRVRIIKKFLDRLDVEPLPGSRAVSISFASEDAVLAARSANALADLYLNDQLESKFESVQRASGWLNERVMSLRQKVKESEDRVEEYREKSGLLEGGGTTLTDQEVSQINAQVIVARNERAEAEAHLQQIRRLLESEDGVESAGEVLNSGLIQRLREQEVGIRSRLAELSVEYGDLHPTMVKLRAEVSDLRTKIDAEIDKIVFGLQSRVRIATTNEANLNANLSVAKRRVGRDNKALVTLRSLEREAEANRLVLEGMLTRFAQTSEQDDLASQRPDARIISRAVVPNEPSYPMKKAILALVFVSAGFIGLMLAFAREFMDEGFRSGEQFEEVTGLRSLGFVPFMSRRVLSRSSPLDYFLKQPVSPFSESFRTLYSALTTTQRESAPKTILITSCLANEGKSTVALCLTSLVALSGKRAIIVDADCRRPSVSDLLGIESGVGLIDYLTAQASIEDIIHTHDDSGADVIAAGRPTRNPPATLASPRLDALLQTLASSYDYVIVDSPPIMAVSDALMITGKVDATVMVTRWGSTRRSAVRISMKQLSDAGGNIAGGLLTMVDARKYSQYGYGDSGAYTGELANYQNA